MIGRKLGHYEIVEKLGEGGMGVVYKARDPRLDRFVALKVLPAGHLADPDRKRRFVQEARAASALNHPNIVTIHDICREDGVDFIVMEFISGKTLERLIPNRGMRLAEALRVAAQVADALNTAHNAGILHRDLKPGNLMVTETGLVKILDFGLAKLAAVEPPAPDGATLTIRPDTEKGMILGTISYMSPEQAQAAKLDPRSDIFSFGAVLYEMIGGRRAFVGESKLATLSQVLRDDPKALGELVEGLPREVERLVNRCLRKDPARRFQDMADLKVSIEDLREETESGTLAAPEAAPARRARSKWVWAGAAGGAMLTIAAAWLAIPRQSASLPPPSQPVPLTSFPGAEDHPTFSPDGSQIAFSRRAEGDPSRSIYITVPEGGEPLRVTKGERDASPAWSPDGRWIAFVRRGREIVLAPPVGGIERRVAEVGGLWNVAWLPGSKWLVGRSGTPQQPDEWGLFLFSIESGEKRKIAAGGISDAAVAPDGRTVAFSVAASIRRGAHNIPGLWLIDLDEKLHPSNERLRVESRDRSIGGIAWTADGRDIIYGVDSGTSSRLFRVASAGGGAPQLMSWLPVGSNSPAISRDGKRFAYSFHEGDQDLWRVRVAGAKAQPSSFLSSTRVERDPAISPDGKKVAFISNRNGSFNVWVADTEGTNARPVSSFQGTVAAAQWSPDGKQLAVMAASGGSQAVYLLGPEGGIARKVVDEPGHTFPVSWSANGKSLYFHSHRNNRAQSFRIGQDGSGLALVGSVDDVIGETPDGREVVIRRPSDFAKMPAGGGEQRVIAKPEGVTNGLVTARGSVVYYCAQDATATAIFRLDTATGQSRLLMDGLTPQITGFSVAADESWLIYSARVRDGSDLMLVENFQ